ncbi:hypothetical protein [Paracoccus sp. JM45]|uniref:hypothetical protein n=1 Tax=Paracoccus sp. JM45 TaxID=2283626 RepID=UPI0021047B21|nr:hypothetical protein [Paracoccus sp. JM45]
MAQIQLAAIDDLDEYPLTADDRLDSHYFMAWERRRWLNCDMRLKGTYECRSMYFDLINIAYDQSPIGTLPTDTSVLAKMLFVDRDHFDQLCRLEFGPLHKWRRVRCDTEIRLMHPMILKSLTEAISRKEDHRARSEAASVSKRLLRLRTAMAGYQKELAENDAAVRWIDDWLLKEGCEYRSPSWIERGISRWSDHMLDMTMSRNRANR